MTDITTNFIYDWVYWLKNEYVRFDGHIYVPESAQTVGLADETIASRIKRLKTFINWCLRQEIITKIHLINSRDFVKIIRKLIFYQYTVIAR
ncbi:phage integrase SAM-like domain-containing protein [Bacillus cereus group sp. BfR-BA-01523]|uniref:phage integrase SAM-like domain-containing protein n=1 Tax=Bacillus cereus group sp. BfR-BA-01523 TaxID=2920371 RepID=UPI001F59797F|nr:phage integrase SAM-like domain-containing protein [Bacillus cereus group sp. BfR-BA-01523]